MMKPTWTWPRVVGAGIMTLAMAGCSTSEHIYVEGRCITCVNNPVTGEPINHDPAEQEIRQGVSQGGSTETVAVNDGAGDFIIESKVDVDTAYARIRSAFSFRSSADFSDGSTDQMQKLDVAYHHEANPGAFYRLSDYEGAVIDGREHRVVLKAQIERNREGSRVRVSFSSVGPAGYESGAMQQALKQRFETALQ